ncbi:MAG: PAS domain-containing protein [Proteobacteria bacterium]|nr:PAS domain-containing protein [Pseudomonadota bacterium]
MEELTTTEKRLLAEVQALRGELDRLRDRVAAADRRTEDQLCVSEERFRVIFESALDAIFIKDLNLRYILVNPAMEKQWGRPASELIGLTDKDFFGEEVGEEIMRSDRLVLEGRILEKEHTKPIYDRLFTFHVIKVPLRDADGRIIGLCGIARDISQLKETMEALRQSEKKARALLDATPHGMMLIDTWGKVLEVNQTIARTLEGKGGDMVGESAESLMVSQVSQGRRARAIEVIETGQPVRFQDRHLGMVFDNYYTPIFDDQGQVFQIALFFRDITNRVRAEEALRQSEVTARALLNSIPQGMLLLDTHGTILALNETAARALKGRISDLVGQCVLDIVSPHMLGSREERMREVIVSGKSIHFRDEIGHRVFDNHYTPIFDQHGNVVQVAVYASDISARVQAEAEILSYQEGLRRMGASISMAEERERRRLALHLHDKIGQALAISKIKLKTVMKAAPDLDQVHQIEEVYHLVDEMIQETRSLTSELSPPVLYELGLAAALEWLADILRDKYDFICKVVDRSQSEEADGDVRVLLFRSIHELLLNVIKHAGVTEAEVAVQNDGSLLKIIVRDKGTGFVASKSGADKGPVKTFGLFSIRERLESIGGRVEIQSRPNQGTRVTLVAPVKTRAPQSPPTQGLHSGPLI